MLFFLIGLAAATTVSAYQSCTPGAYYRTDCNICVCNEDGSAFVCTEKPCSTGIFNQDGNLEVPLDIIKEIIPEATKIEVLESQLVEENHVSYVQVCTPNSTFYIDCNSCTCSPRGTEYACTKMGCRSKSLRHTEIGHPRTARSANDQVCEPKSQFKEYCNSCVCSADGSNYACTRMACDQNIFNKDGTFKAPLVCEPLRHFYDYCNFCTCSKDGLAAACTRKACDKGMFNKDGSLKYPFSSLITAYRSVEQKKVCEPGKSFKNYCNQCVCALDGSTFSCTKMHCDKNTWNKDGTLKTETKSKVESVKKQVCKPGKSLEKLDCNNCLCTEDGLNYICTKKDCDKNIYSKDGLSKRPLIRSHDYEFNQNWGALYVQGDRCTPGHIFYSLCNQCICLPNGLSAYCTLMLCYED